MFENSIFYGMCEFTGCPFGGNSTISNSTPPTNAAEENAAISVNTRFSFTVDNEVKELAEGLQPKKHNRCYKMGTENLPGVVYCKK